MDTTAPTEATPDAQPGDLIRAKWTMDGATTLEEAAARLERHAAWLRELHRQGWTFAEPVRDDYGQLVGPDGQTADPGRHTET